MCHNNQLYTDQQIIVIINSRSLYITSAKIKMINFHSEAFGNSQMFPDLKRDWEAASPECRYRVGTWKRMFPNARDGKFPRFFWEKSGSREMALGTQTSTILLYIPLVSLYVLYSCTEVTLLKSILIFLLL